MEQQVYGMEEVIGSIPIRSTKINSLQDCQFRRGCGRVLNSFHFRRQHHCDNSMAGIPLLLGYGTSVNVERRPATRVAQQFLSHLDVDAQRPQICGERVTEAVPADLFARNASPRKSRANPLLQYAIRTERSGAFEPN